MKLISFTHDGRPGFGRLEGDTIVELSAMARDLKAALAGGSDLSAGGSSIARSAVRLAPVIPNPDKIVCVGVNYLDHAQEMGRATAPYPTLFTRFADTLVADGEPLIRPAASERFDYEGELAVIIGKAGRHIAEADALGYVAGYGCFNDGSIRDWQNHTTQFTPGKNFPASGGLGPWIVTPDEAPPVKDMVLTTRLNGQVVQHASCADLIFDVPKIIAYVSTFTALTPGMVIATGTPGGVGAKRVPPLWMKPGDVVEVEIEGVGLLTNRVEAEA